MMKPKKKEVYNYVNQSNSEIPADVIAKLRGKDLFPELTKRAKEFMEKADFSAVLKK